MATKKEQQPEVKNNAITLRNKRVLTLSPTKLKYFANGDFGLHLIFTKHGVENILMAKEGRILALKFLSAVLDKEYKEEQVERKVEGEDPYYEIEFTFDHDLEKLFDEELSLEEFRKIIEIAKEVNGINEKN